MNEKPNYYDKAHLAWLKHCATIIEPCGKRIDEVITYLTENYDTETMHHEKPCEYVVEYFAQVIDADSSSDLYRRAMNELDLNQSDMTFTLMSLGMIWI